MNRYLPALALAGLSLGVASPQDVRAQAWGSIDMSLPMMSSQLILSQQIVRMSTPQSKNGSDDDGETQIDQTRNGTQPPAATLYVPRVTAAKALAPAALAKSYPLEKRAEAEQLFRTLLTQHSRVMRQLGVEDNDMAGAVAAFIAGAYMAYNDADFPDANFQPLVEQMGEALKSSPDFAAVSTVDKRDAFEKLAIIGMFNAGNQMALKANPDLALVAKMREEGGRYLTQFLKVDPGRVKLDRSGLSY